MKSIIVAILAATFLVACGKKEVTPAPTPTTPVVDGQGQPVKTESGAVVATETAASAPVAKTDEVKK